MKRGMKILGIVVAIPLVVAIALPFVLDANQFRPLLQSKLSEALGRQVTLGALHLSLLSGSVTASGATGSAAATSRTPAQRHARHVNVVGVRILIALAHLQI